MSGLGSELRSAERQNPRFFHDTGFREDAGTLLLPDMGQWGSHPGLGQKPGLLSIRQRGTLGLLSQLLLLGIWEFSKNSGNFTEEKTESAHKGKPRRGT